MNFNETFAIDTEDTKIRVNITRIVQWSYSLFKLIPIQNSGYFYFGQKITMDPLILPKLYAALTYLTGESDNRYDDYKGSFSFSFDLEVNKNNNLSKYCYHIYHYRSYVEFSLYEIVPKSDPRNESHYAQPDDKFWSDKEITSFCQYFCLSSIKNIEDIDYVPKPFLKYSDSNLLLFGYDNNQYFYEDFDDQNEYIERQQFLKKKIIT